MLRQNKKQETNFDLLRFKSKREDVQRVVIFNNDNDEYFAIPVKFKVLNVTENRYVDFLFREKSEFVFIEERSYL